MDLHGHKAHQIYTGDQDRRSRHCHDVLRVIRHRDHDLNGIARNIDDRVDRHPEGSEVDCNQQIWLELVVVHLR